MIRLTACVAFLTFAAGAAMAETDAADIAAACEAGSNLPPAVCACVGERAMTQQTQDQRAMMVAAFIGDEAEVAVIRARMPATDLIGWATFFRTAPVECMRG